MCLLLLSVVVSTESECLQGRRERLDVASDLVLSIYSYLVTGYESLNPLLTDTLKTELGNLQTCFEHLIPYIAKRRAHDISDHSADHGFLYTTFSKVLGSDTIGLL